MHTSYTTDVQNDKFHQPLHMWLKCHILQSIMIHVPFKCALYVCIGILADEKLTFLRLDCTSNKTPEPNKIAYAPPSLVVVPWIVSSF